MNSSTSSKQSHQQNDELLELLEHTQLETFWQVLRDQLQITRLAHFEYVEAKDLEKIGMSKPAIRRLLDAVHKKTAHTIKRNSTGNSNMSVRPAPPPPLPAQLPASFSPNTIIKMSALHTHTKASTTPFNHDNRSEAKLYTNNITKNALTSKLLNLNKNKRTSDVVAKCASISSSSSSSSTSMNHTSHG